MLVADPQLAPPEMLVRYLAIFHRFFAAVVHYTAVDDKPGMLLGGWLADELHNVPAMLWNHDADLTYKPAHVNRMMEAAPEMFRQRSAPERLVTDCRRILAAEGGARELGLNDDLADLYLAPLPKMRAFLNLLYHACLSMRLMFNYGARPSPIRTAVADVLDACYRKLTGGWDRGRTFAPWNGLERAWTAQAQEKADANRRLADVLLPIPQALVRWSLFDEAQFRKAGREAADASEQPQLVWNIFFNEARVYPL